MFHSSSLYIAIPVKDEATVLPRAVSAAANTTYPSTQIHIFDDCSTDGTYEVACELERDLPNVFTHRNALNLGVHGNYNKALTSLASLCKPDSYIALLGANDEPEPDYYASCIAFLDNHPECQLCFSYCGQEMKFPGHSGGCALQRRPRLSGFAGKLPHGELASLFSCNFKRK